MMVYRVLFGAIPLLLVAMLFSGAIPLSSVIGAGAVHRPAEEAKAMGDAKAIGDARAIGAASVSTPGTPEMVTNGKEASDLFRSVDASLDEEIKRRAPEERRSKERLHRQRLQEQGKTGWAPEGAGWGS